MAVTAGTVTGIKTVRGGNYCPSGLETVQLDFTVSGTYAQADDSKITAVTTAIENLRRDGRVVTLVDAMPAHAGAKVSDPTDYLGCKTVTISTNDITLELCDGDFATEYANATAIVSHAPLGIFVCFTTA